MSQSWMTHPDIMWIGKKLQQREKKRAFITPCYKLSQLHCDDPYNKDRCEYVKNKEMGLDMCMTVQAAQNVRQFAREQGERKKPGRKPGKKLSQLNCEPPNNKNRCE